MVPLSQALAQMRSSLRPRFFVCALLVSLAGGCTSGARSFPEFHGVDRIDIACSSDKVASITNPAQVRAIVAFVNERQDNWTTPWAGVPVGSARVEIHRGKDFLGSFGSGRNFFETQQDGGFYSRDASEEDLDEFKRLLQAAGASATLEKCWSS
jgi:hypothetical protein